MPRTTHTIRNIYNAKQNIMITISLSLKTKRSYPTPFSIVEVSDITVEKTR